MLAIILDMSFTKECMRLMGLKSDPFSIRFLQVQHN
jgi:hypothetical protein